MGQLIQLRRLPVPSGADAGRIVGANVFLALFATIILGTVALVLYADYAETNASCPEWSTPVPGYPGMCHVGGK